jgi:tRNA(Ile)-lysidine synthase
MNPTISTVQNFMQTLALPSDTKVLVAVSGGADSVAMLHILHRVAATEHSEVDGSVSFRRRPESSDGKMDSLSNENSQSKIENRKSKILCAHINHHLRGADSDADEQFTAELCKQWNIPFFVEHVDVESFAAKEKLSIETAARRLRLDAFVRIARRAGCQTIATAHHKDDQAETILFRLLRGTSFPGLTGIRPVIERDGLQWIRPMLHLRRTDIESYCRQNNLSWRDDASNLETLFCRNWIRHRLLPAMQQGANTDLAEALSILAQSALRLQQHVESAAVKISQSKIENGKLSISSSAVQQSGPFVAGEILRIVLNRLNCGLQDMSLSHYQRFFQLLDKNRAVLELPGGCIIRKKNDTLTFETATPRRQRWNITLCSASVPLPLEGTTQFGNWRIQTRTIQITESELKDLLLNRDSHLFSDNLSDRVAATERSEVDGSFSRISNLESQRFSPDCHTEPFKSKIENRKSKISSSFRQWFDLAQIQQPLAVCQHKPGDAFVPFGRKTPKKVARFLIDSQIPPEQRQSCFIIKDNADILWLAPIRRSSLAAITINTIDVLEIRIEKS